MKLTEREIDELYGLEPVYEPGHRRGPLPEEFVRVQCPYCGEPLDIRADLSAGERSYIEDCQVCCRPMELVITLGDGTVRSQLAAHRTD